MPYKLSDGTTLALNTPFTIGEINYPANWLRLSTDDEKTALGISYAADPAYYDSRFYESDGTPKSLEDVKDTFNGVEYNYPGVKSSLLIEEKVIMYGLLSKYDWQVIRKAEKGVDIDAPIVTYRDTLRTVYETRKAEINACKDIAAIENLYGTTSDADGNFVKFNMTQYPEDPYNPTV